MVAETNDPYIERAKRALERAKIKREEYSGDCSDCRYSHPGLIRDNCGHPAVTLVAFNLTDGYAKKRIIACDEQRDKSSVWGDVVCGPNGALFEPRRKWFFGLF